MGRVGGERVFSNIFIWGSFRCCAFCCLGFCWQKRRMRKAKEWLAETLGRGERTVPAIFHGWQGETRTAVLYLCSRGYVRVHCQLSVTADAGGGRFWGECRDLDQGISASIEMVHFRLIPSDYLMKPVWTWLFNWSVNAVLSVFLFLFPHLP